VTTMSAVIRQTISKLNIDLRCIQRPRTPEPANGRRRAGRMLINQLVDLLRQRDPISGGQPVKPVPRDLRHLDRRDSHTGKYAALPADAKLAGGPRKSYRPADKVRTTLPSLATPSASSKPYLPPDSTRAAGASCTLAAVTAKAQAPSPPSAADSTHSQPRPRRHHPRHGPPLRLS
jgi:hypothetical protein